MATASTPLPNSSNSAGAGDTRYTYFPLALGVMTTIFFMWGFLTCLNDILIPHLKAVYELTYFRASLIQFTFFGTYFIMSLPAGALVKSMGYKKSIVAGLAVAGVGALGFWPAAASHSYYAFLGALFVLATGITILQVAANPYVALLGPERTASSRLTLAQALNSAGTAIAPIFGGLLILADTPKTGDEITKLSAAEQITYRAHEASVVQGPYLFLAVVLFVLAVLVFLFRMPSLDESTEKADPTHHTLREALRYAHVFFGVLAIFFYVGSEVTIGSYLINFLALPNIGNMSQQDASKYVTAYWTMAMIGRFLGSFLLVKFPPRKLLAIFATINIALLLATILGSGHAAIYSIVAIGLFNSIMFPTIFSLGIERMGPLTGKASSLLIMAIVGGALFPPIQGFIADHLGNLQIAFIVPLIGYAYIVFYGLSGSKIRSAPVNH
jgi:MFS transporter, FHS family, L-fucose permease